MSIEAIHYVMKTDIPDGIAKLVAFVIADYAHAETGQAWPKIETLARKCSQSVRTVQRKIRVLEALGILRVEERHGATGRQRENLFVLYLPGVPRPPANDVDSGGDTDPTSRMGDTQSPIPAVRRARSVTPGGDSSDTPGGDTAVTPRGIPQRESTRRESPRREIPGGSVPPAAAAAATAPVGGSLSPKATLCPEGFEPGEPHYSTARAAGFDDAFVREVAASMHRWSHANAHRPIARKADWSLAFTGILDTALREATARAARAAPRPSSAPARRSTNGALSLAADMIGVPDDPAAILAAFGLDAACAAGSPGSGHGSPHGQLREPAGGTPGGLPALLHPGRRSTVG